MGLSRIDLKILSAISKAPLGTIKMLSKLAGVSPNTFSRRLERLRNKGIFISVSAEISYPSLSLEPLLFFFDTPFKNLEDLEKVLEFHPYTRYRVRCIGSYNGIYALFAIPNGTFTLLLELVERLKEMGIITNYSYEAPVASWIYSESNFEYYDPETDSWNFDWKTWESYLEEVSTTMPLRRRPSSVLHRMDEKDMNILRQLTINAREKRSVIAKKVGIPIYHLSRRLKFYEKNRIIEAYRVIVHGTASRLLVMIMFDCECPLRVTQLFVQGLNFFPFQSTLIPTRRGFFLQASIPPLDLPKLGSTLQKHCTNVKVLWSDYESSMRYWFDPEPYKDGEWIGTRSYMITEVLRKLENHHFKTEKSLYEPEKTVRKKLPSKRESMKQNLDVNLREVNKMRRLNSLLIQAICESLSFGEVILHYIELNCSIRRDEIIYNLEAFVREMEKIFGDSSSIIFENIIKNLYSSLGVKYKEKKRRSFQECVIEVAKYIIC